MKPEKLAAKELTVPRKDDQLSPELVFRARHSSKTLATDFRNE